VNVVPSWAGLASDARPIKIKFRGEKVLRAQRPSAAVASAYEDRLKQAIEAMERSVLWWIRAYYRANPPATMAFDDVSVSVLRKAVQALRRRWLRAFDAMSEKLARYFAKGAQDRADGDLKRILREAGFTVEWTMTPAMRDVVGAIVAENVALIKSIPREQLDRVEGAVMRSVQQGRDLKMLYDELREGFGVSKKRARLISRDQNNKATSLLQRARFVESGIRECIWMHSHAGKTPRPSHVKAGRDKVRFDPAVGWYDPHEKKHIWPGVLINCRCTCKPVIKGFSAR
jgi:uncharacterized protein with gpF-like domain